MTAVPPSGPAQDDVASAIRGVLEPLEQVIDENRAIRADDQRFLAEKRARGLDRETQDLFAEAAKSPAAPDSLRRVARRVADGELSWDDVFAHRAGPDGEDFLHRAWQTAAEHADDLDVSLVDVPAEARAEGADPAEVREQLDTTLDEARAEHDRVWREDVLGEPEPEAVELPEAPGANDSITPA